MLSCDTIQPCQGRLCISYHFPFPFCTQLCVYTYEDYTCILPLSLKHVQYTGCARQTDHYQLRGSSRDVEFEELSYLAKSVQSLQKVSSVLVKISTCSYIRKPCVKLATTESLERGHQHWIFSKRVSISDQ